MIKRYLFVTVLIVSLYDVFQFPKLLEAQVKGEDVANAVLEQFERFDDASIRWQLHKQPGRLHGANYRFSSLIFRKMLTDHAATLSDEDADTLRELVNSFDFTFENHEKSELWIGNQLVRSGANVQVQFSPIFRSDSAKDEIAKYKFPDKLATTDYLNADWKGGLIFSVFDSPKCIIFSEMEYRPLDYVIHTNQGSTTRTILFRWNAPLNLPEIDEKVCEIPSALDMAVLTDVAAGSFIKYLKSGEWRFSELADGKFSLTRETSVDQRKMLADELRADDPVWTSQFLDVITVDPHAGMLPVRIEKYSRQKLDNELQSVRIDKEVQEILQHLNIDGAEMLTRGYTPMLIADFEWKQSPNEEFYYIKRSVEHLFNTLPRGVLDLAEFPGKPRRPKQVAVGPAFAMLDINHDTDYECGLDQTTILETSQLLLFEKGLKPQDFKFACPAGVEPRNDADSQ